MVSASIPASRFLPWLDSVADCHLEVKRRNHPFPLQIAFGQGCNLSVEEPMRAIMILREGF